MKGEHFNNPGNFIDWDNKEKKDSNQELEETINLRQQNIENQALPLAGTIALLEKDSGLDAVEMALKLAKIVRKGAITSTAASILLFSGLYVDHLATQWKITEKVDPETDQKIYEHQDPKTTHLINVLAGREHFTHQELIDVTKLALMNRDVFKSIKEHGQWEGTMEDLKNADEQTVVELTRKIYLDLYTSETQTQDLSEEAMLNNWAGSMEGEADDTVYETLWQMEIAAGSPKLQLVSDASIFYVDGSASYNSLTNTTNLPLYANRTAVRLLVAELAHGHQFNHNFFLSNLKGIRDVIIKVPTTMSTEGKSFKESYHDLYETDGTIENDAHSVIEPKLQKEFYNATQNGPRAVKEKQIEIAKIKKAADEYKQQEESTYQIFKQFEDKEREAFINMRERYSKTKNPEKKKKMEADYLNELAQIKKERAEALQNLMFPEKDSHP